ncbi:protein TonB isoform X2 [Neocloeon triangulifer]|uniref:protein TonB isoform X2 n=1 Tax=Neocloeon triangulifer TaxID=2078957 RepID=UPI00286F0F1A|nr:protein TonB isoform X2 [Neocloeon triangulifer]
MVSKTIVFALAACAFLAAVAQAAPADDESMVFLRVPRAAQRQVMMRGFVGYRRRNGNPMSFAHGFAGARSQDAPAYAPVEDEEEQDEPETKPEPVEADEPVNEDEEEPAPVPVVPTRRPGRAQRPAKAPKPAKRPTTTTPAPAEEEEEYDDEPVVPANKKNRGGATAIATAVSRGAGASALSNAVAYGGTFSGGSFRHRYAKGSQ